VLGSIAGQRRIGFARRRAVIATAAMRRHTGGILAVERSTMKQLFAVIRTRGPAWNSERPLEDQADWDAHASFMDALLADGFVVLGGPLAGSPDVLLVVRASDEEEIRSRLAGDVWTRNELLRISRISPWTLRLGSLAPATSDAR
jgi:hypothetical protein